MPKVARGGWGGGRGGGMRAAPYMVNGGGKFCDNCGAPVGKACDLCGKIGHLKFKCRLTQQQGYGAMQPMQPFRGGRGRMMMGGGGGYGVKTCDNCHGQGHVAAQCQSAPQCHCCGSTAHGKAQCPSIEKVCGLCGKVGHLKVKCRQAYY